MAGPHPRPATCRPTRKKTVDELRCFFSGWQFSAAWVAYTDAMPARMALADAKAPTLVVFGQSALDEFASMGLIMTRTYEVFDQALTHRHNRTHIVPEAGEGMIIQNSTLLARLVIDFLGRQSSAVVV